MKLTKYVEKIDPATKRKHEDEDEDSINEEDQAPPTTKRRKISRSKSVSTSNGTSNTTETAIEQNATQQEDKRRMPPPNLTPLKLIRNNTKSTTRDLETGTVNTNIRLAREAATEYDMERARRHAAATSLPEHSGIWEKGEKDLFFHLAYRGFEPIFPRTWMHDFPTMPLSLYQAEDESGQVLDKPLIEAQRLGEFRAIKEMRELLELGKDVRDKAIASPGARIEATIEKAINKYISWAIDDAGITVHSAIRGNSAAAKKTKLPVHVVVKRKKDQSTAAMLEELKSKMHDLARKHRHAMGIHESVEADKVGSRADEEDEEMDATQEIEQEEDDLPVLYGMVITGTIIAVFTMNSQTPLPKVKPRINDKAQSEAATEDDEEQDENSSILPTTDQGSTTRRIPAKIPKKTPAKTSKTTRKSKTPQAELEEDYDNDAIDRSNPRFVSDFDFSSAGKDVWNSLVVAIFAMQIRVELLELDGRGLLKTPITPLAPLDWEAGTEHGSDPDA
ncbi:hypothetical protein LTR66_015273 [Elasticomyces elasticus]|nr:hypothetical protein LTR66_015273 [Elasticomyces elasticus]